MNVISIIIPTLHEAPNIARCLQRLHAGDAALIREIIVVDASSKDDTAGIARANGAKVAVVAARSRAFQMNAGAAMATGDILYFVHADVLPPTSFAGDIMQAINEGAEMGRFRFRFDSPRLMLKINSWFTRFDRTWVSGGDETLFIRRDVFGQHGGYNERFIIMEEYDLVARARKTAKYTVIQKDVLVSARKYEHNSWWAVQRANLTAFRMFRQGAEPAAIKQVYHRMIRHPKDI
ncbi:glycosyltransferase [Chitinophaga sp. XS-30]|nr:glycosyltransferase [Chitinophaga sp. XS-30]